MHDDISDTNRMHLMFRYHHHCLMKELMVFQDTDSSVDSSNMNHLDHEMLTYLANCRHLLVPSFALESLQTSAYPFLARDYASDYRMLMAAVVEIMHKGHYLFADCVPFAFFALQVVVLGAVGPFPMNNC